VVGNMALMVSGGVTILILKAAAQYIVCLIN
jgi:hypothetical protein